MRRFVFALLVALALVGGTALAAFSDGDQQPARAPATAPPDPAAFEEAAREVRSSMAGSPRDENDEKPERGEKAARDRGEREGKGPPPWAKAHGRRCKGKSKRKAEGQKHSEFVRCVHEGKGKAKAKGPKKARGPKPGKGPKKAKKSR